MLLVFVFVCSVIGVFIGILLLVLVLVFFCCVVVGVLFFLQFCNLLNMIS